jgi:hypothetical protein
LSSCVAGHHLAHREGVEELAGVLAELLGPNGRQNAPSFS